MAKTYLAKTSKLKMCRYNLHVIVVCCGVPFLKTFPANDATFLGL